MSGIGYILPFSRFPSGRREIAIKTSTPLYVLEGKPNEIRIVDAALKNVAKCSMANVTVTEILTSYFSAMNGADTLHITFPPVSENIGGMVMFVPPDHPKIHVMNNNQKGLPKREIVVLSMPDTLFLDGMNIDAFVLAKNTIADIMYSHLTLGAQNMDVNLSILRGVTVEHVNTPQSGFRSLSLQMMSTQDTKVLTHGVIESREITVAGGKMPDCIRHTGTIQKDKIIDLYPL